MVEFIMKGTRQDIALVKSDEYLITDVQSAIDLMATIFYEHHCTKFILNKENIVGDFFKLSTRLAGEVLQKYVNYKVILAIVGDYSEHTSKPLQDFIRESNQGNHCFFVSTIGDAIERLDSSCS